MAIRIAYLGPGLAFKTANIQSIAKAAPSKPRLVMSQVAADRERMLFVNVPLPLLAGGQLEVQLATLPGSIFHESSWNAVLLKAQGIVFVADSQAERAKFRRTARDGGATAASIGS